MAAIGRLVSGRNSRSNFIGLGGCVNAAAADMPPAVAPVDETANDSEPQTAALLPANPLFPMPKVLAACSEADTAAADKAIIDGVGSSTLALFVTIGMGDDDEVKWRPNELLREINSFWLSDSRIRVSFSISSSSVSLRSGSLRSL